jgi:hypothetical protein
MSQSRDGEWGLDMVGAPDWWSKRRAARSSVSFVRKWPFAFIVGAVLGVLALIDKGNLTSDGGLSSPCRVEVTADQLPTRSDPDPSASRTDETLKRGDLRGATTNVRNGYRQLTDDTWALNAYLRPLPPADKCDPS